jgi:hypothetical protein
MGNLQRSLAELPAVDEAAEPAGARDSGRDIG